MLDTSTFRRPINGGEGSIADHYNLPHKGLLAQSASHSFNRPRSKTARFREELSLQRALPRLASANSALSVGVGSPSPRPF